MAENTYQGLDPTTDQLRGSGLDTRYDRRGYVMLTILALLYVVVMLMPFIVGDIIVSIELRIHDFQIDISTEVTRDT